jgi:uncharacterized protein YbaR (Trm112 family)
MSSHPSESARPLTQQDLAFLVCPVCHADFELASNEIRCTGCNRRYPIVDGLPVLLADRAL